MHNILVPVLHLFIEADVPGIQDRCVYYSSRIYSSSKLLLNSSRCNSTIVRKSVRGICIQSKALQSFGACTYNQRNNDLRKVNFDTSCFLFFGIFVTLLEKLLKTEIRCNTCETYRRGQRPQRNEGHKVRAVAFMIQIKLSRVSAVFVTVSISDVMTVKSARKKNKFTELHSFL